MRQVPLSYLIVGDGRMAKHFCHYLTLLKLPFKQWSRQKHTQDKLNSLLQSASHIVLLISDNTLETFAKSLPLQSWQLLIHFSGSLSLETVYSAHPLCTFSQTMYQLEEYLQIPFVIENKQLDFAALLPGLPNPSYVIGSHQKAYYHALCVLSGNFTCILWQKFFNELQKTFGFDAKIALPYLKQTLQNLINQPQGALTGPLARNDQKTIQANLAALKEDPFLQVYEAFVKAFNEEKNHECA